MSIFQFTGASHTHPGKVRSINEDSVLFFSNVESEQGALSFLIVADGIGGHKAGDIASKITVETVFSSLEWFLAGKNGEDTQPSLATLTMHHEVKTETALERRVRRAVETANRKILAYAQSNPENAGNLGSTITCALVQNQSMVVAHVGDSRAYLFRNGELRQITEDHSFVGQLIREGQLPENAYYEHPRRNIITRALGQMPTVQIDMQTIELYPGDKILICTDGLWEMVRDNQLLEIIKTEQPPEDIVNTLVAAAIHNGGVDNIGAVVGQITE